MQSIGFSLHSFGGGDADDGEGECYHTACGVGKQEAGIPQLRLRILYTAGGVEAVEACRKLGDVLVYTAGVVVPCRKPQLLRQRRKLLYKLTLLCGA